jgi:hypothetical protein
MEVVVTQTAQGPAFSVNGAPARPLPWIDGLSFRQGSTIVTFRQNGNTGPASEVRFQSSGSYYILKRQ